MGLELWGMAGVVLIAFGIGVLGIINYLIKKPFLPGLSKQLWAIIGVCAIAYAGSQTAWWGLSVPGVPPEPTVPPGVIYEAEGSESLENTDYDASNRVFTTHYYENVGAEEAQYHPTGGGAKTPDAIIPVVVTITVFRTDGLSLVENAGCKIWAVVPTFYGKDENASIAYAPIDKDVGTQKYEVAFKPAGISARDEYNNFSIGNMGSRAITVTADPYHIGLCQLDNFDTTDVKIYITGVDGYFTLRFVKIGETT